ncbi:MAG: crotonase [Myxococcales bacterium]|nr:crotonase [Myxococcales bacterium]
MSSIVTVSDNAGVRTLTLNRPERRNALSSELVDELRVQLVTAGNDESVHVIVLTGAGKAFCAGGDLNPGGMGGVAKQQAQRLAFVELLDTFTHVGKPTVAKINGHALGGGFGLALACDVAIAAESATLGTPEIKVGLFPMMIMPLILRHMGRKATMDLLLRGQRMTATEALENNCLTRVVADDDLDAHVDEYVGQLCSFSASVHRLGVQHFHRMADLPLHEAAAMGADGLGLNFFLEDAAEGLTAFLTKRDPEWKGR